MKKERKLGRGVAMVGAGMSAFNMFKDRDSKDLFAEAFVEMSKSVDKGSIQLTLMHYTSAISQTTFSPISPIGAQFFRIRLGLFPNLRHGLRGHVHQVRSLFVRAFSQSPPASTMLSWLVALKICRKGAPRQSLKAWLWRQSLTSGRRALRFQGCSGRLQPHILRDMVHPVRT